MFYSAVEVLFVMDKPTDGQGFSLMRKSRLKFILASPEQQKITKENSELWISKKDFIKSI